MNNTPLDAHEAAILEKIYAAPARGQEAPRQRDLSRAVGVSLGMTNAIVRRLARKGWLTVRKINNRNIQYAVTPRGIRQITRRSLGFLRRTISNIGAYRQALARFVDEVDRAGYTSIVLVGGSDLDFVVEWLCQQRRILFTRARSEGSRPGCWYLYGERTSMPPARRGSRGGRSSVYEILAAGEGAVGPGGGAGAGR